MVEPLLAWRDNYMWVFKGDTGIVCVDPGDADPVLAYLEQHHQTLSAILLTHHHQDHVGGVLALKKAYPDVKIYSPNDARVPCFEACEHSKSVISADGVAFQVIDIPGHTSTHIAFYAPGEGWLFCGDTLFSAGCGRVFDGTMAELYASLGTLKALPETTQVYCGHEYTRDNLRFALTVEPDNIHSQGHQAALLAEPSHCSLPSTIGLECLINPFLRVDTPGVRAFAASHGVEGDPLAVFACLREEKNRF